MTKVIQNSFVNFVTT